MSKSVSKSNINRREFLKKGGSIAAGASVLGSFQSGSVFAGEDNTIRLALIGCGGRGNGAAGDAMSVAYKGPIKLYAMADLVKAKMDSSQKALSKRFIGQVDVSEDRKFTGFDGYKKAIDILRPGDVAMCTTRAYIRPLHVEYAISKGINVFMEKPFASDPAGLHRLLRADAVAKRKGLKVAQVKALPESGYKSVMKDSDEERGRHICTRGKIIQIRAEKTAYGKLYEGVMTMGWSYSKVVKYIAVGSTRGVNQGSRVRFCGVVIGRSSNSNVGGGTTHSVQLVGVFDITENQ